MREILNEDLCACSFGGFFGSGFNHLRACSRILFDHYTFSCKPDSTQINNIRQTVTPLSIFVNNFLVSILAIVPIGGLIFFGRVWINTGQTIGQLAYSYHVSPLIYVIGVYIPVGTIENMAYSVIIAESLFLTYALAKGTFFERLKYQTWKSLILYIVLLAIAATVEATLITGHL